MESVLGVCAPLCALEAKFTEGEVIHVCGESTAEMSNIFFVQSRINIMSSHNNLKFEVVMEFNDDWLVLRSEFVAAEDSGEAAALVSSLPVVCDGRSTFVIPPTILQVSQDEPALVIKRESALAGTKTAQAVPLWQDNIGIQAGSKNNAHLVLSLVVEPELKSGAIIVVWRFGSLL